MQKINLRELYPDVYKTDVFVDVAEEVVAAIRGQGSGHAGPMFRLHRDKKAPGQQKAIRAQKLQYSLTE